MSLSSQPFTPFSTPTPVGVSDLEETNSPLKPDPDSSNMIINTRTRMMLGINPPVSYDLTNITSDSNPTFSECSESGIEADNVGPGTGYVLTTKKKKEINESLKMPWQVTHRGLSHLNPLWRAMDKWNSGITN
jgi:hypothetical protein